jgi:restriction system protein
MSEPAQKRTSQLLRVVFQILWSKPDGLPAREVLDGIARKIKLSDDEIAQNPATFTPQYERIVRLATNMLVEAGWLLKNKERWYLTDNGKAACKNIKNAEEIYTTALSLVEEKKQLRESVALTVENAEEIAWQQIWHYLNEKNPLEFKLMIGDLLKALNFHLEWISPPGKNHGYIDMIAYPKPLGSSATRIKVHVKHTGQAATLEGLRAFWGVLNAHDLGLFVSSGGFTDTVMEEVRNQDLRKIRLISLEDFFELWVENYDTLSQEARRRFPLNPIFFLALEK